MSRPAVKIVRTTNAPWLPWVLFTVVLLGLLMLFSFISSLGVKEHQRQVDKPDDVTEAQRHHQPE